MADIVRRVVEAAELKKIILFGSAARRDGTEQRHRSAGDQGGQISTVGD